MAPTCGPCSMPSPKCSMRMKAAVKTVAKPASQVGTGESFAAGDWDLRRMYSGTTMINSVIPTAHSVSSTPQMSWLPCWMRTLEYPPDVARTTKAAGRPLKNTSVVTTTRPVVLLIRSHDAARCRMVYRRKFKNVTAAIARKGKSRTADSPSWVRDQPSLGRIALWLN